MRVIERNVMTGKAIERDYTEKELEDIALMAIESENNKKIRDKKVDIQVKREEAIEEILMARTSTKAKAYHGSIAN